MENTLDLQSGRTCPEHSAVTKVRTSGSSSKSLSGSASRRPPRYLRLVKQDGHTPIASWETDGALRTVFLTLNTGESPSDAVESTLSSILEANPPKKFYLSVRACEGILRRAERRGKELPEILKAALMATIRKAA